MLLHLRTTGMTIVVLTALLSACKGLNTQELIDAAHSMALARGFERQLHTTGNFQLVSYRRITNADKKTLRVYIEGDGKAWLTRYRPSLNPTPRNPLALKLALRDKSANVAYLARPCQYHPTGTQPGCDIKYWTAARYAEAVVASIDQALDQMMRELQLLNVELVGFSGGGTLALLVAARRQDIHGIRTVAGNLATEFFTQYHRVSPTPASLDPMDYTGALAQIPQLHFIGAKDQAVPRTIAEHYYSELPSQRCTQLVTISGVSHHHGWLERWSELLQHEFPCGAKRVIPKRVTR